MGALQRAEEDISVIKYWSWGEKQWGDTKLQKGNKFLGNNKTKCHPYMRGHWLTHGVRSSSFLLMLSLSALKGTLPQNDDKAFIKMLTDDWWKPFQLCFMDLRHAERNQVDTYGWSTIHLIITESAFYLVDILDHLNNLGNTTPVLLGSSERVSASQTAVSLANRSSQFYSPVHSCGGSWAPTHRRA